jgi:hypothetical protein
VRHAFNVAEAHGEHGLGALKRLDLALLIHTEDEGLVGRITWSAVPMIWSRFC